ncbi:P-loop NTPase, partial [Staphylococcus aureus]|uniref:P-loop NTPase n=1 Tax=Staphylococcus aureus TaxID=1280 RepID=UPI0011A5ADD6
ILTTPHPTPPCVAPHPGPMPKHTHHSILPLIQNMTYFQTKHTPNKQYLFPKRPPTNLPHQLNTQLLPQLPLHQPSSNPKHFAPSIYQSHDHLPKIYTSIPQKLIPPTNKYL